jgi:predicted nucleic acid-binding Zn ribbon protein
VDDDGADPVAAALARAQGIAHGKAGTFSKRARRRRGSGAVDGRQGGYSGAHPDGTDPQPVGDVLDGYLHDRGWERPLNQARVFSDWAGIVGADVAAHCAPSGLHEGELKVVAESTAWATQLRLLAGPMLARLAEELGPDVVSKIHVAGPSTPNWRHGRFSIRGARGPRDTYG